MGCNAAFGVDFYLIGLEDCITIAAIESPLPLRFCSPAIEPAEGFLMRIGLSQHVQKLSGAAFDPPRDRLGMYLSEQLGISLADGLKHAQNLPGNGT